jgi:hypothetical protein
LYTVVVWCTRMYSYEWHMLVNSETRLTTQRLGAGEQIVSIERMVAVTKMAASCMFWLLKIETVIKVSLMV